MLDVRAITPQKAVTFQKFRSEAALHLTVVGVEADQKIHAIGRWRDLLKGVPPLRTSEEILPFVSPSPVLRPISKSTPSGVGECAWHVGHVMPGPLLVVLPQHIERSGSCGKRQNESSHASVIRLLIIMSSAASCPAHWRWCFRSTSTAAAPEHGARKSRTV